MPKEKEYCCSTRSLRGLDGVNGVNWQDWHWIWGLADLLLVGHGPFLYRTGPGSNSALSDVCWNRTAAS